MKKFYTLLFILGFWFSLAYPQVSDSENKKSVSKTMKDWSYAIDTTWGAGISTVQKLYFFDTWWYRVDQTWGGFPNLIIKWDSLKIYYRPIIEAGVSRGRYMGIMSRLLRALNEEHASVVDPNVDIIYGIYYDQYGQSIGYPNYPTFNYKKGIPLLNLTYHFRTNFGAGVTAYNDSIALVYSIMPNHPLNLQPGDIILGYDGLPWTENLQDLIDQELPLLFGGPSASSPKTLEHVKVLSAGMNWGLFDTIDILKYSTGDTLHYSTSLLSSITQPYFIATEQLPVSGIPFPDVGSNIVVSWGLVEGTSIGYIHVWNWYTGNVTALFEQAVDELMHIHNVTGLILDFRVNQGGYPSYANGGFKHLFNEDPTSNFSTAQRIPGDDHFLFNILPTGIFINHFSPTPELFDHPIAVLIGPICASAGDMNAFRMRFHPMARFFGKKSMGAFTSYDNWQNIYYSAYDYKSRVDNGCMYSNYNNEGFLIHKGSPVDEEVWLTKDGVANGQDDVVNRALEWINNVVYPHDILSDNTYYSPVEDTVHLSTNIENQNSHQISARGYIHNLNDVLIDSVDLVQQILNADGENWSGKLPAPSTEDYFKVSVAVFDQTTLDKFTVPYATRFSTVGPVTLDSLYVMDHTTYFTVKPFVTNQSITETITAASIKLICSDSWITSIVPSTLNLPNITPGAMVSPVSAFNVNIDTTLFQNYFNFKIEIMSDGWVYWTDSMRVPPIAIININPTELAFGGIPIDSSETKTFVVTDYGDEDLIVSNITISEPIFAVNITNVVIPSDSSQEIEVTFTPTALQTYSGIIEIIHNAEGSPNTVIVTGDGVTDVEDELQPIVYSLEQNYPNPFNPSTMIKYSIPEISKVIIKLYNLLGEEITTLVNEEMVAGYYKVEFNASNLPSGVYFYQLKAGSFVETKKMVLMK